MTIAELSKAAFSDLSTRRQGALLEWAVRNAEAEGCQAAVERKLRFLEERARDVRDAQMRAYPPTADQVIAIRQWDVSDIDLEAARAELADAVAMVAATAHVLALLDRRGVEPLRSVQGGRRAG